MADKTYDLTDLEKKACKAIGKALDDNNFGDNEWAENEVAGVTKAGFYDTDLCETTDIKWDDRNQLGGLLTSLENKGVIALENDPDFIDSASYVVKHGRRVPVVIKRPRTLV